MGSSLLALVLLTAAWQVPLPARPQPHVRFLAQEAEEVFRFLAARAGRPIEVDECAKHRRVALEMRRATLAEIFDAVARHALVTYIERGATIAVLCNGERPEGDDPGPSAGEAKVVQTYVKGHCSGIKLYSIKPGSTLSRRGFKSGDAVIEIAGKSLCNDPLRPVAPGVIERLEQAAPGAISVVRRSGQRIAL